MHSPAIKFALVSPSFFFHGLTRYYLRIPINGALSDKNFLYALSSAVRSTIIPKFISDFDGFKFAFVVLSRSGEVGKL
jgi:hypothetical protein